jgi:hypothetical protein
LPIGLCEQSEAISIYSVEIAKHLTGARDDRGNPFLMAVFGSADAGLSVNAHCRREIEDATYGRYSQIGKDTIVGFREVQFPVVKSDALDLFL